MSKTTNMSLEETISKQQFFIDLYKAQIDEALIEDFKENVCFFERLGCNVLYKRQMKGDNVFYFIDPQEKKYGTIGFQYKNKGE